MIRVQALWAPGRLSLAQYRPSLSHGDAVAERQSARRGGLQRLWLRCRSLQRGGVRSEREHLDDSCLAEHCPLRSHSNTAAGRQGARRRGQQQWRLRHLTSAEVYDSGLEFEDAWRPTVSSISSPLALGNSLSLTGSGFRGFQRSEASGGGTNNSATNYPLVQIRRLDNEQWLWVSPSAFTDTAFTSLPVTNALAGPALVTVFVNGIPSVSNALVLRVNRYVFLPTILR